MDQAALGEVCDAASEQIVSLPCTESQQLRVHTLQPQCITLKAQFGPVHREGIGGYQYNI